MTRFILNEKEIVTDLPSGTVLLDFIRYHRHLCGTKIGCREGDCGACTVLVGEREDNQIVYRSMTSCLLPIGNVEGCHVVTIEGINPPKGLSPVQEAMVEESATQCGFCTPGFVLSLTGYCLRGEKADPSAAIAALDGNICRCTGYKSIERAAARMAAKMYERGNDHPVSFACKQGIVPAYFEQIVERLNQLEAGQPDPSLVQVERATLVAGGTDLYVRRPEELSVSAIRRTHQLPNGRRIERAGDRCQIGPATTVQDLAESGLIQQVLPGFDRYVKLVSSTPIRNMATIAGNFVNASPIGDFSIFFLALDASLSIAQTDHPDQITRILPLRKLYKGYKQLDLLPGELIAGISFQLPKDGAKFNFEKVSKRTHLDIASVNSAMRIRCEGSRIREAALSAGGVAPVPLYLEATSNWLIGKTVEPSLPAQAMKIAEQEIKPIPDARGSRAYKQLLLGQLLKAHWMTFFPDLDW